MLSQKLVLSAAGAGAEATYVDDVFSCDLWTGNTTTQTITNGIDLSGEGGLVWTKERSASDSHNLFDTERGAGFAINTNTTNAQASDTQVSSQKDLYQFNSTGYSIGQNYNSYVNANGSDYVGWTFRKCPGFFDVVTYTGNGSHRDISHSLGSEPGSIWIKRTDNSESWIVYHRSLDPGGGSGATAHFAGLELESTGNQYGGTLRWSASGGGEDHTATTFHVSGHSAINGSGNNYVAYIFAHDDQSFGDDGDEAVIKCGSYTGNGGTQSINVGFEPQFLITKRTDSTGNWFIHDVMRKFAATGTGEAATLRANSTLAEFANTARIHVNSTGFDFDAESSGDVNASSGSYIYIAIRRPHKPPEAGSEVVALKLIAGSASTQTVSVSGGGVTDMTFIRNVTEARDWIVGTRLLGANTLKLNTTDAQTNVTFGTSVNVWDQMTGTELNFDGDINRNGRFYMHWQFTRKHGVFDVVAYDGDGQNSRSITHGLGSAPELVLIKNRTNTSAGSAFWVVHSTEIASNNMLRTNTNGGLSVAGVDSYPTASAFPVSDSDSVFNVLNNSTDSYIAYLFASLSGVSKIGKYTGTGNDVDVDCGFTAGARFVLIKRTDSSGSWYLFDSARGINSGNDSYILAESTSVPVSNQDYIDPLNAGFTITSSAPADLNTSGGTYLFLAIA